LIEALGDEVRRYHERVVRASLAIVIAGCGFRAGASPDAISDDGSDLPVDAERIDAGPDDLGDVAHVPTSIEDGFDATGELAITGTTQIDTGDAGSAPSIDLTLPPGTALVTSVQDGGGPELAILQVGALSVSGQLIVRGERPLVIIAWTSITVTGAVDASAQRGTPGGGGYGPALGPGRGDDGTTGSNFNDGGAGGGGFGTVGGAGQASGDAPAGGGGDLYGTPQLDRLEGGSGGGNMSPPGHCSEPPGAGGGAVQLFARGTITIDGSVRANGGGGSGAGTAGGGLCSGWSVSGPGAGSGGAIYLQASTVAGSGSALAQGGGGGGGSNYATSTGGGNGADGPSMIAAATGGNGAGTESGASNDGGDGGYRDAPPSSPSPLDGLYDTGGGGGGAVGRIVIHAPTITLAGSSPAAITIP
jgi:hypothetical protein